ncbi:MAG: argininosuccinate lyase [Candidatus Omnitrophica bacterium]|nr:Argininosuccinate lyase [bacterium]NUN94852.1 argininosuccinate lyase [Candidatus Omnitrophota bacterium]
MSNGRETKVSAPVWSHSPEETGEIRERLVAFCAGRDVEPLPACDEALLHEDLATNEASTLALCAAGVFSRKEAAEICSALQHLRREIEQGYIRLDPRYEDVHINIEELLRAYAGEVAGKIHSGRSRNDQVACDIRLWQRDRVLAHLGNLIETIRAFIQRAEAEKATVMPGFSHHQRAFVTTFGHLLAAHAEAWLRDVERGLALFSRINRCPLGAAAGFGTSWPIDRDQLASFLGFEGLIENSLDAVSSRLEVEADVAGWIALWMTHCSALAQDLILFSMEEFRWVCLSPETTTGSSIMPQKRNPDFAEVIKGKTALAHGALASLLSLGKGQPSGYHRDSQYSKQIGQDLWGEAFQIPEILRIVIETAELDRERMRAATRGGFLEAAEWADYIAREAKIPFREVYTAIGQAVDRARKKGRLDARTVNATLKERGISYRVDEKAAARFESPEGLLAARATKGSPNPSLAEAHLTRLRSEVEKHAKAIRAAERKISAAEKSRLAEIARLAKG